jgi:hypothetical protein
MGIVTTCSHGAEFSHDETHSWPASSALAYFTLAYITRDPIFSLLFSYLWESFEFLLINLWQSLAADTASPMAAWIVEKVPEAALQSSLPGNHQHAHQEACIMSPKFAFILNPLLFLLSVCLWSVAVEYIAGVSYNHDRGFGVIGRRVLYYAGFIFAVLFSTTNLFVHHATHGTSKGLFNAVANSADDPHGTEFDPDIGLLMTALVFITLTAFVPMHTTYSDQFSAIDARRAYAAYAVYVAFSMVIVLVGVFGGPFLNIRSAWLRTVLAVGVLWISCILAGSARIGFSLRVKVDEIMEKRKY